MCSAKPRSNDSMNGQGRIELICGPMFSGKTTTMIARLVAAHRAGLDVVAIKPLQDIRYSLDQIVTHDGKTLPAVSVGDAQAARRAAGSHRVVGIDEVHFFDDSLVDVCHELVEADTRVVAAGVEMDHRGQPFEVVRRLADVAHDVTRLTAICARCGAAARHSQRLAGGNARIVVGGAGMYEPRCDRCFEPG